MSTTPNANMKNGKHMSTKTTKKRSTRKSSKPTGARALLLALTVTGTLAGWGYLAQDTTQSASPPQVATPAAVAAQSLVLGPIPTVIAPPAQLTTPQQQANNNASGLLAAPATTRQTFTFRPLTRARSSR